MSNRNLLLTILALLIAPMAFSQFSSVLVNTRLQGDQVVTIRGEHRYSKISQYEEMYLYVSNVTDAELVMDIDVTVYYTCGRTATGKLVGIGGGSSLWLKPRQTVKSGQWMKLTTEKDCVNSFDAVPSTINSVSCQGRILRNITEEKAKAERERKQKEAERQAELKRQEEEEKERERERLAQEEARKKEEETKKANAKAAAEAKQVQQQQQLAQKQKEEQDRIAQQRLAAIREAELERQREEKRKREKEESKRNWEIAKELGRQYVAELKDEWEIAQKQWDELELDEKEKNRRIDQASSLMIDAKLASQEGQFELVKQAIHLYPYHPDISQWIRWGGVREQTGYYLSTIKTDPEQQKYYQQSLSYDQHQRIAFSQIDRMWETLKESADITYNFKDPDALMESVNRRMTIFNEKQDEIFNARLRYLEESVSKSDLYRNPASKEDVLIQSAASALGTGIVMAMDARNAKLERQYAQARKEDALRRIKKELLEDTRNGIASFEKTMVNATDAKTEATALNGYYNLSCFNKHIEATFNYENTRWFHNPCDKEPAAKYLSGLFDLSYGSNDLKVAWRKAQLYKRTELEAFKTGALMMVAKAIKADNSKENLYTAYDIYAMLSSDPVEKLQYQLAKHDLYPEKDPSLKDASLQQIRSWLDQTITNNDADLLRQIATRKLHRYTMEHFNKTTIPGIIKSDNSNLLYVLLDTEEAFREQAAKDALLLSAVLANAEACCGLMIANDADVNQTIPGAETPVPLALLAISKQSDAVINEVMTDSMNFVTSDALVKNEADRKRIYGKLLQVAMQYDNLNAFLAISKYQQKLLTDTCSKSNELFAYAVKQGASRVLDSMFRYSAGYQGKEDLVFSTSEPSVLRVLKKNGLDLNRKNKDGMTAMHLAILGKKTNDVTGLLQAGASASVMNSEGFTVAHLAAYQKQAGTLQTIASYDRKALSVQDANYGWTPLHFAARENDQQTCTALLQAGASKTIKDKWGRTPYSVARERYFLELKEILK